MSAHHDAPRVWRDTLAIPDVGRALVPPVASVSLSRWFWERTPADQRVGVEVAFGFAFVAAATTAIDRLGLADAQVKPLFFRWFDPVQDAFTVGIWVDAPVVTP